MARSKSTSLGPPTHQQIAKLLDEQEGSGLSIAAFARMRDLPAWRLYQVNRGRSRRRSASTDFVEVSVARDSTAAHPPLEVDLPIGVTVRVPAEFDEPSLRRLIEVLATC